MRVVVTGTRHGRPDVPYWLDRFVAKFEAPHLFVLGDADGVDAQAHEWAKERGIDHMRVLCNPLLQSPGRFHQRNQDMVDMAVDGTPVVCLAFPDADSRGTWDCVRRAKKAGVVVHVLPLRTAQNHARDTSR